MTKDGVSAKLIYLFIYTCNGAELQEQPTRLFREMLTKVELSLLQDSKGSFKGEHGQRCVCIDSKTFCASAEAYYTCSFNNQDTTAATTHAPLCILQAHALLQSRLAAEGGGQK